MEIVEASILKGKAQRVLVVKIVRKVVELAPISDDKEKLLLDMIDEGIIGNVIDLVVAATKGELDINAMKDAAAACCCSIIRNKC